METLTTLGYNSPEAKSKLVVVSEQQQWLIPSPNQTIIKDECIWSCDTPFSPNGLFVNLKTLQAVGWDFLHLDAGRTGTKVYLQYKKTWKRDSEVPKSTEEPTKLAIGVEGGFSLDASQFIPESFYFIYSADENVSIPLNDINNESEMKVSTLQHLGCSELFSRLIKSIIDYSSTTAVPYESTWEEETKISSYGESLIQISNPPHIPPSDWKCAECGNTKNLWMHLSDGYIGCGRKLYGVPDSGCLTGENGAAVRHYEEDKENRPLAVKLGTITPSYADVYSYVEDAMVIDPKLGEHLAHFGINIQQTEKTEKTLAEMQIDYNKNFDWSKISESNVDLVSLRGKGHIGLRNFGNTCYMNSSIQLLLKVSELTKHFTTIYPDLIQALPLSVHPHEDIVIQFMKVLNALSTDRYVEQQQLVLQSMSSEDKQLFEQENPNVIIAPLLFRSAVARRHVEFSTAGQQDAEEFLSYFLEQLEKSISNNRTVYSLLPGISTFINDLFGFQVEEKLVRLGTSQVRLSAVEERVLSLHLSSSRQNTNNEPQAKKLRSEEASIDSEPLGTFQESLADWSNGERIEFAIGSGRMRQIISAQKSRKIKTFPPYLLVQLKRFYLGPDWSAEKIVAPFMMPEELDLSMYRATGLSPNEIEWHDDEAPEQHSTECIDESLVAKVQSMGLTRNAALRAIRANSTNASVEVCIDWILTNMDDPNINEPLPSNGIPCTSTKSVCRTAPQLVELGLSPLQIEAAMLSNNGDVNQAVDWFFSVGCEMSEQDLQNVIESYVSPPLLGKKLIDVDGRGSYSLVGIISHMGKNANCGHYVCHTKEFDEKGKLRWVLFNDTKVAESQQPPINLGYLYLYRRVA